MKLSLIIFFLCLPMLFLTGCNKDAPAVGDQIKINDRKWELIWSDEFNGEVPDLNHWNIADGPDGLNNDVNYNTPENVYIEDGVLVLRQQREDKDGFEYTTGKVNSQNKFTFLYGRIEVRAMPPKGKGLHTAYWLIHEGCSGWAGGDNSQCIWPPEIDIAEILGQDPRVFHTTYHAGTTAAKRGKGQLNYSPEDLSEEFHVYAVEWEPEEIRWYFDDALVFTANDVFVKDVHLPFGITLDTVVGGNWPQAPDEHTILPTYNRIDYVRVFKDAANPTPIIPEFTPTPVSESVSLFSVSASSTKSEWPVENAIDGDDETFWTTGEMQTAGQWLRIDFGSERIFDRLVLQSAKPVDSELEGWIDDYPRGYAIQTSTDGENWGEPIAEGVGSNPVSEIWLEEGQCARYVRIVQTGESETNWWTIFELQFYHGDQLLQPDV